MGAVSATLTDAGRARRRKRLRYFYAATGGLGGVFVLLLALEIVQRSMVA